MKLNCCSIDYFYYLYSCSRKAQWAYPTVHPEIQKVLKQQGDFLPDFSFIHLFIHQPIWHLHLGSYINLEPTGKNLPYPICWLSNANRYIRYEKILNTHKIKTPKNQEHVTQWKISEKLLGLFGTQYTKVRDSNVIFLSSNRVGEKTVCCMRKHLVPTTQIKDNTQVPMTGKLKQTNKHKRKKQSKPMFFYLPIAFKSSQAWN